MDYSGDHHIIIVGNISTDPGPNKYFLLLFRLSDWISKTNRERLSFFKSKTKFCFNFLLDNCITQVRNLAKIIFNSRLFVFISALVISLNHGYGSDSRKKSFSFDTGTGLLDVLLPQTAAIIDWSLIWAVSALLMKLLFSSTAHNEEYFCSAFIGRKRTKMLHICAGRQDVVRNRVKAWNWHLRAWSVLLSYFVRVSWESDKKDLRVLATD